MDEDGYEDGWGTEARVDRLQLAKPAAGVDDHRPPAVGSCQLRHRRGVGMAGHEHRDLQARGGPGHRRRPVVGQELADGHVLAVPRWTRCLPWEIWRQAGGRTRGRPAADQKHPRERDHQQAHHVDQLEQQGAAAPATPRGPARPPPAPHTRGRQPPGGRAASGAPGRGPGRRSGPRPTGGSRPGGRRSSRPAGRCFG
jgi:hypothetical protein